MKLKGKSGIPPLIGTIDGNNQSGPILKVKTELIHFGDMITIEGVEAIHRVTKESLHKLRYFIVTGVFNEGTSISIYPAINPKNVSKSPKDGASIIMIGENRHIRHYIKQGWTPSLYSHKA